VLITFPDTPAGVALVQGTIDLLVKLYTDIDYEWDPQSFAGYAFEETDRTITLTMAKHIEHAVRQHCPGIADGSYLPSQHLPAGASFQSLADGLELVPRDDGAALPAELRRVSKIAGSLRYPERCTVAITLPLHRLSCVAASPPPEANLVADLTLELAYEHRHDGLTYGGAQAGVSLESRVYGHIDLDGRPPAELDATADATWGASLPATAIEDLPPVTSLSQYAASGRELVSRDLYSQVITFGGAAVLHTTKKLALLTDSSMGNELAATSKVAENLAYAREVARAIGAAQLQPTQIGTDNKAHMQVAMRRGGAARARHLLRRYIVLMQRIQDGECRIVHIPDPENPADFLTKFVPADKFRRSLRYVTGAQAKGRGVAKHRK
jgi:hypothetical protein